jgi:hypothetical protein
MRSWNSAFLAALVGYLPKDYDRLTVAGKEDF